MPLIGIFASNLLPVILLATTGFVLGRTLKLESRTLGRIVFYIFSPILVFNLLAQSNLPPDRILVMLGFAASLMLITALLAFLTGKALRLERSVLMAVVLTTMTGNHGNFGLPVVAFAFGTEALALASIYFVTSAIILNTLGVFIASLGHTSPRQAFLGLFKVPALYAILLGMLVARFDLVLPDPLQKTVGMAAAAAIPCMLVLLGMEIQRAELGKKLYAASIPVFLRLVAAPLIALVLAAWFHLPPDGRNAGVTEAGMPSAVMTTVVASEYNLEPSLVTTIVFITTLLSPLTLTPLLFFLGA